MGSSRWTSKQDGQQQRHEPSGDFELQLELSVL